jgi:hypothetical protein
MSLSSFFMFVAGVIFSFFPQEILQLTGEKAGPLTVIMLQFTGALYFGFAMLNHMAKANLIGGIYSRPVAIGNLLHFAMAGLALLKGASAFENAIYIWLAAAVYAGFALAFGYVVFTNPANVKPTV